MRYSGSVEFCYWPSGVLLKQNMPVIARCVACAVDVVEKGQQDYGDSLSSECCLHSLH